MPRSDTDNDQQEQQEEPKEQRLRLNPRLVFADPDAFFNDLLMEEQEGF